MAPHILELVQLCIRLIRIFIRPRFRQYLLETREHPFLVQLISVVLQTIDEFLDGFL